jgi:MazG family protein
MTRDPDDRLGTEIAALRRTLRSLRGEGGCPWDREQKLDDVIGYLIEESYELLRAEQSGIWREVEEELGDVLFIVVFIHELMLEKRKTDLAGVVAGAHRKIVRRHPHVFGSTEARTRAESLAEWERMKRAERRPRRAPAFLDDVPDNLPPLRRAAAVQRKAAGVGFDWPDGTGILDKLEEEIAELRHELRRGKRDAAKSEIGDLFFTVVNLARRFGIDSESALERTTAKFTRRFNDVERRARRAGRDLSSMTLEEMEALWRESKTRRPAAAPRRRSKKPAGGR